MFILILVNNNVEISNIKGGCDILIIKNTSGLYSQFLTQSFKIPWNFLSDRSIFCSCLFQPYLNLSSYPDSLEGGKCLDSFRMEGDCQKTQPCDYRVRTFSPTPKPWVCGGVVVLEIEFNHVADDFISRAHIMKSHINTLAIGAQGNFLVGSTHTDMAGSRYTLTPRNKSS